MRLELFSDVRAWFCVHVTVPMCESKIIMQKQKFTFFKYHGCFQPLYCFQCSPKTPKSIIFFKSVGPLIVHEPKTLSFTGQNIAKTWHNVIASLCDLCHISLKMLSPLCLIIKVF